MPLIVPADILQLLVSRRTDVPLVTHAVALYDIRVVSEEQIEKWAEEAEQGYDVEEFKRRGRGRPGRGAEPMQVVAEPLGEDGPPTRELRLGFDTRALLLETVVLVLEGGEELIIHAMPARKKYLDLLP